MADKAIRPGFRVEVKGIIPHGCKLFTIKLGKNDKNVVIHFEPRFDYFGDKHKIVMNSMKENFRGTELKESFFPFQMGSEMKICFTFEKDKIFIQLPAGSPLSFPVRFPITDITYVSVEGLTTKYITLE